MANDKELNGAAHTRDGNINGAFILDSIAEEEAPGILRSYVGLVIVRYRRLLIGTALASMAAVFCLTYFVMHPKYQATATIRPAGQNPNSLGGLLQTVGMTSQSFAGVGIDSDIGTNVHDPDELVAVLTSYTFTANMIKAENLGPKLTGGGRSLSGVIRILWPFGGHQSGNESPLWGYYRIMSSAFDCENSVRTGNITLTFIHRDPEFAKRVLQLYLARLRDQLRAHDVAYNKAAANSLQQAAGAASDPMLRDDLYQLAAMQVQKTETAEANADFAFNVLEEPYVPPYPVKPRVELDTLFAGILCPALVLIILILRDWAPRVKQDLAKAESESRRIPDSIAVSRKPRRVPSPQDDRPYSTV